MELELEKLPAIQNYSNEGEFLGVTSEELMVACKEWAERAKSHENPHKIFNLRREIVEQTAEDVVKRNLKCLSEHTDKKDPLSALSAIQRVPMDKPVWVLRMLRKHGFSRVELSTWVAASELLGNWVKLKSEIFARTLLDRFGLGGQKF